MSLVEQQENMSKLAAPDKRDPSEDDNSENSKSSILQRLGMSAKRIAPLNSLSLMNNKKNDPPSIIDTSSTERKSVLFDGNGRFATKRRSSSIVALNEPSENFFSSQRRGSVHNRLSNMNGPAFENSQTPMMEVEKILLNIFVYLSLQNVGCQVSENS